MKPLRRSTLEDALVFQLRALGLPPPVREHRFHATRKWRFDLAYPEIKLAVECEGGLWIRGRHNRPMGYQADLEKYNAATELGWRVLRYSDRDIKSGRAVTEIERLIASEKRVNQGVLIRSSARARTS